MTTLMLMRMRMRMGALMNHKISTCTGNITDRTVPPNRTEPLTEPKIKRNPEPKIKPRI